MMERPKDTKKQHEASTLELSFEKASYGDVFKDSLNSEDCILILERFMENIKKKMEELCITTKNTKESQIKGELQLVSMNERINFISEIFDEFEKGRHEKDDIIKNLSKKTSKMVQRVDELEKLVNRQEQYSRIHDVFVFQCIE